VRERSEALADSLNIDAAAAAQLYRTNQHLFTQATLVVALQMRGAARALMLPNLALVEQVRVRVRFAGCCGVSSFAPP